MRSTVWTCKMCRTGMLVAVLAGAPALAWAGGTLPSGKAEYVRYCASCHGETGKGDGVVAELMNPKPTDLTQLAKAKGGALSQARLRQLIDGTQTVRAHGNSKMPVWGEVLRPESPEPVAAGPRGTLMMITDYVMSIQQK